jgi:hypothetical protein
MLKRHKRHYLSTFPASTLSPSTLRCTTTLPPTISSTPSTPKPKAPNPPRKRIAHRIDRTLRTPQTNFPLPARDIKQLDRSARPQPVAAAVVLRVLCENETPQHGHVPAEGERGPGESLQADGWAWLVCGVGVLVG